MAISVTKKSKIRQPKRLDLYERVADEILIGKFKPNEKITENLLAKRFKVSRTPIREVLFKLEQDGLIGNKPNSGFYVLPLDQKEIQELYPILWTLECLAIRNCYKLTKILIPELIKLNEQLLKAKDNPKRALEIDSQWHYILIKSCSNQILKDYIQSIKNRLKRFDFAYMEKSGLIDISIKQHAQIIKALKEDQIDKAVLFLEENWKIGLEWKLSKGMQD